MDESSREFHSLNPSTKTATPSNLDHEKGLTAVEQEAIDEVPGSSSDDDDDSDEAPAFDKTTDKISSADYKRRPQSNKTKRKQIQMQASSSKGGRPARDRSFAARAQTMKPKEKAKRAGGVVGEKVVTFEPQGGKKKSQASFDRPSSGSGRSFKDRRSASNNTFRGM